MEKQIPRILVPITEVLPSEVTITLICRLMEPVER